MEVFNLEGNIEETGQSGKKVRGECFLTERLLQKVTDTLQLSAFIMQQLV
jgi:hypothetical protein